MQTSNLNEAYTELTLCFTVVYPSNDPVQIVCVCVHTAWGFLYDKSMLGTLAEFNLPEA